MYGITELKVTKVERDNSVLKIFLAFWFPPDIDTPNKGWRNNAWISINTQKMRILPQQSTSWLIREPNHRGSEAWMLLAHPAIAIPFSILFYLSLPIWWPLSKAHATLKYREGLTPLNRKLLSELKGKLDPEIFATLKLTLQNELRISNYLSKQISFEDARELLSGCDLTVTEYPEDSITKLEKVFRWVNDDGICVANAQLTEDGWYIFQVLGTSFDDAECQKLVSCYRSTKTEKWRGRC